MTPDIIIPVTKKNLDMIRRTVPYIERAITHDTIYLIAAPALRDEITQIHGVVFFDENEVVDGLTLNAVSDLMDDRIGDHDRAGWYLQQFLKLGWALHTDKSCYITWDADSIPLHPIPYLQDGRYLLTQKIEYHPPYFDTLRVLFDGDVRRAGKFSFIAENMIFDTNVVREMLARIEANASLQGTRFFEKILYAVDEEELPYSGFSEFETYGNYISTYHPDMVTYRRLKTFREAEGILGREPSEELLKWAAGSCDMISFEGWQPQNKWFRRLTRYRLFRALVPFRTAGVCWLNVRTRERKRKGDVDLRYE